MNNSLKLLLVILLTFFACSNNAKQANSPEPENKQVTTKSKIDTASDQTITSQNIGQAQIGITLGELKQIVSPDIKFVSESEFMVDLQAITVTRSGQVEYYLVFPASEEITDDSLITYFITQKLKKLGKQSVSSIELNFISDITTDF